MDKRVIMSYKVYTDDGKPKINKIRLKLIEFSLIGIDIVLNAGRR